MVPLKNKILHKLKSEDLNISCQELGTYLLGKLLVRQLEDGKLLKGRIVETECYLGGDDKGSVSCGGRRTPKNEAVFMPVGTTYIYMTYGMYYCFNISSQEPGASVFLRALEPLEGLEEMIKCRAVKRNKNSKPLLNKDLCNGPSKLCMSFNITRDQNKINVCDSEELWLENDPEFKDDFKIVKTSRIGIASAGPEWSQKPLRFYIFGNENVSKKDKKAEEQYLDNKGL